MGVLITRALLFGPLIFGNSYLELPILGTLLPRLGPDLIGLSQSDFNLIPS